MCSWNRLFFCTHFLLSVFLNNAVHPAIPFRRDALSFMQWFGFLSRIEKMWVRDGAAYFFGPIFIHPEETEHEPTKMFYKKEVFLSNLEETCPMTCILGNYYQL